MKQEILEFHFKNSDDDIFYVSEKNHFAFSTIKMWPNWKKKFIYIYGPKACGKTHLSNIWLKKSKAKQIEIDFLKNIDSFKNQNSIKNTDNWVIEDIENLLKKKDKKIDEKILNLINLLSEKDSFLLITSTKPPKYLKSILNDLLSRLNSFLVIEIKEPDESLLENIIYKKLKLRQIKLTRKQIKYLVNRMERTYLNIKKITALIDKISLQSQSGINTNLFKKILEKIK